jgi:hypothetical protein
MARMDEGEMRGFGVETQGDGTAKCGMVSIRLENPTAK